ncbi:MAG: peptidoglycan DD-metalloendopeptidase family protein [Oscillospiraceae bacterium]|jgi:murein DD-endopeptidase MepM/ murein hydrolase activator NlpD|nr:peptidoglycan DD-metalloendopeptidase family protein [Oscillospiraceae bacterium]
MNDNKKRGSRFVKFVEGKGFYIVLFLCIAVIGVSAWTLNLTMRDTGLDLIGSLTTQPQEEITIPTPAGTIAPPAVYPTTPPEGSGSTVSTPPPTVATVPPVAASSAPEVKTTPQPAASTEPVAAPVIADAIPTAFIWPVAGNVSAPFAVETLSYDRTMQDWRTHKGIDIEAELGTVVKCAADGVVESVISEPMFGTSVTVKHGGGLRTVYRNLASEPAVGEGQNLKMGDTIGSVGQTATFESGDVPHLHFEATLDGEHFDPGELLPDR